MQTPESNAIINGNSSSVNTSKNTGLEKVKAKLSEAEHQAVQKFEDTKELAKRKYEDVENYVKNADFQQTLTDVRSFTARKPLTAIGIGVGVGIMIARLMGGRR